MSKSEERASDAAPSELTHDSVYDFLYSDRDRIRSFLAQFDTSGVLDRVIQREGSVTSANRGFKVGLTGGATVMGTGGSGGINLERGPGLSGSEESERIYDPLWANALAFLNQLTDRDLIIRDVSNAKIGQIVLISGALDILDLQIVGQLMRADAVRHRIGLGMAAETPDTGNRKARRAKASKQAPADSSNDAGLFFAVLDNVPTSVQARLTGHESSWFTLRREYMAVSADDLLLKHGTSIDGEWHVVGILDARPSVSPSFGEFLANAEGAIDFAAGELMSSVYEKILPFVRMLAGRPSAFHGITPLLVFREIAPA